MKSISASIIVAVGAYLFLAARQFPLQGAGVVGLVGMGLLALGLGAWIFCFCTDK